MLLSSGEREGFSQISLLFALSYAILLAIGSFAMAFANFSLGFVLFMLGIVLLVGNEVLVFRKLSRKQRNSEAASPTSAIFELLNFAMLAYLLPSAIALFLFFFEGWGSQVLIFSVAGFAITTVKVAAKTAQLFLSK